MEEVKERDRPEHTMLSVTISQGVIHQQTLLSGSSKKDSSEIQTRLPMEARSTRRMSCTTRCAELGKEPSECRTTEASLVRDM